MHSASLVFNNHIFRRFGSLYCEWNCIFIYRLRCAVLGTLHSALGWSSSPPHTSARDKVMCARNYQQRESGCIGAHIYLQTPQNFSFECSGRGGPRDHTTCVTQVRLGAAPPQTSWTVRRLQLRHSRCTAALSSTWDSTALCLGRGPGTVAIAGGGPAEDAKPHRSSGNIKQSDGSIDGRRVPAPVPAAPALFQLWEEGHGVTRAVCCNGPRR